ncbi:MAG TPA: pyrroloquinoline quinone biosynthesis peptide chaperone PqqD [Acidocella sp.]|nr:pyrroloquinoline quinone biosynthesis peptide chaperone PqqD [Acidocella sp.]
MTVLALEAVPRLKPGVRRRYDATRGQNILLAPERVLVLDDIANAVLEKLDGATTIEALCTALAEQYETDLEIVQADVLELLTDLRDKGMITV